MRIFVTGATGFIGKHLVRRLVAQGHNVRCLVRKSSDVRPLRDLGVELLYGDVNDIAVLHEGMRGCRYLFHLANLYSMWEPDRSRFWQVNVAGTRQVLEAAARAEIEHAVYISTAAVYGKPERSIFDEESAPGPRLFSEYARSKAEAERAAWQIAHQHRLPLTVLYPGIVLGAEDDKASGQYIQDIIRRHVPSTIFHHSQAVYVYVGDVVEAMLRVVNHPSTINKKYLIGKSVLSGREFAILVSEVSGVNLPPFRFPDWMVLTAAYLLTGVSKCIRRPPIWGLSVDAAWTLKYGFQFDGSKAERELGIVYTPIRRALHEAIASYRADRLKLQARAVQREIRAGD